MLRARSCASRAIVAKCDGCSETGHSIQYGDAAAMSPISSHRRELRRIASGNRPAATDPAPDRVAYGEHPVETSRMRASIGVYSGIFGDDAVERRRLDARVAGGDCAAGRVGEAFGRSRPRRRD